MALQVLDTLDKSRTQIADQVRALRQERRWTQAELAERLRLSQSRLSEIERGSGSFSAEQFLLILKLFNVQASHFAGATGDSDSQIQNALVRLGASHLQESSDVLPSDRLDSVASVVREAIVSGVPRLTTALGLVLVQNIDQINLTRLRVAFVEAGLDRRLAWVVENTLHAIRGELGAPLPREWAQRYRRADVVLGVFLDAAIAARDARPSDATALDVLDPSIRSKRTLDDVIASSSSISKAWGIASRLQPDDFVGALRAAYAGR